MEERPPQEPPTDAGISEDTVAAPRRRPDEEEGRMAEGTGDVLVAEAVEEERAEGPPPDEEILGIFADVLEEPAQEAPRVEV